jgi:uncharacterized membrane protein YgdD (TMEM256/DUF423 family)
MDIRELKNIGIAICILGALAVAFGAFGAHALESKLSSTQLATYKTAVLYQFIHVLAAFISIICAQQFNNTGFITASWIFIAGIILFSGSLYILSCQDLLGAQNISSYIGPVTPVGGLLFIIGWTYSCIQFLRI